MQRYFIFDSTRCFGCNGCTAACANINETPTDLLWRTVHKLPPEDDKNNTVYLSISCNHCQNAPCVKACPTGAMDKRAKDGVVIHSKETCIGCRYCQMACPYDAVKWNSEAKIVSKCHFCHERLDQGKEPACVDTCFVNALQIVKSDGLLEKFHMEMPGLVRQVGVEPSIRFITDKTDLEIGMRPDVPALLKGAEDE